MAILSNCINFNYNYCETIDNSDYVVNVCYYDMKTKQQSLKQKCDFIWIDQRIIFLLYCYKTFICMYDTYIFIKIYMFLLNQYYQLS